MRETERECEQHDITVTIILLTSGLVISKAFIAIKKPLPGTPITFY